MRSEGDSRPVTVSADRYRWPHANAVCQPSPRTESGFREHREGLILPVLIRQRGEENCISSWSQKQSDSVKETVRGQQQQNDNLETEREDTWECDRCLWSDDKLFKWKSTNWLLGETAFIITSIEKVLMNCNHPFRYYHTDQSKHLYINIIFLHLAY